MTTTHKVKPSSTSIEALWGENADLFKRLLKESLQEVLEAEMTEVVGAAASERSTERTGYRAGYDQRSGVRSRASAGWSCRCRVIAKDAFPGSFGGLEWSHCHSSAPPKRPPRFAT
jgi:hypothetical protein